MLAGYTHMIGWLATLGLMTVMLALTDFAIWTTVRTLELSNGVGEAVTVNDLFAASFKVSASGFGPHIAGCSFFRS